MLSLCLITANARAEDIAQLEQQAFNAAVETVADCVVQIRTIGGLDQLNGETLAQGPTTGLILTEDGFIVSSAFNFAQQPASILVRLPGGDQRPAELVGRDSNRMLVLLKVETDEPLPTPDAVPAKDIRVGDWAIAVGRTYDAERVNVSVGVVSGLNRMYGRALQCDANASAANYGGPLVDVRGRVLGVLVPMAPQAPGTTETSELAGAEYYDSGIAFAVPLAAVRDDLQRWVAAKDLKRGLLGVGMEDGNPHTTPPKITAVWPSSPASAAGWKADDLIVSIDGVAVESQTEMRFQVSPRYAGDRLAVTIRRDGEGDSSEEIETEVTLAAKLEPYRHAFLGVLPSRLPTTRSAEGDGENDELPAGIAIRSVWPDSPAAKAGLRAGDRVTKLGDEAIESIEAAIAKLSAHNPGDELPIAARRGDEKLELTAELAVLPTDVLSSDDLKLPDAETDAPADEAGDEDKDAAVPLRVFKLPDAAQEARYYLPPGQSPPPGVLLWLADGDEKHNRALAAAWRAVCDRDRLILVMPAPADAKGWSSEDLEFLGQLLSAVIRQVGADPRRVVVGGEGKGGQLAYALALKGRKWVRGVAVADSPLPRALELPPNAPGQRLAVLSIETQNAPLTLLIHEDLQKLTEAGYPATQLIRRTPPTGDGLLDALTRATIARWIDGLDRF